MFMKKNMGTADRTLRIVVAIVLIVLFFSGVRTGTTGLVMTALGTILLITSIAGFRPLYLLFGFNTCKR